MQARMTHPVMVLPAAMEALVALGAATQSGTVPETSVTRLADRPDAVPDDVWDAAADLYDEVELASLLVSIAAIKVWNRLNAAIRQPAGSAG